MRTKSKPCPARATEDANGQNRQLRRAWSFILPVAQQGMTCSAPSHCHCLLREACVRGFKVSNALRMLNCTTAIALRLMVDNYGWGKEIPTMSWFLKHANMWFKLMSSRYPTMALSLSTKDKHSEAIRFLKKLIDIFQSLKIDSGTFKPVQAGLILSTLSILYLQGFLFNEEKYSFVLTSRFTQDSLGKLYSTFCHCNPIRKPVEFKMVLKIITLSQYLKPASMGSYELHYDAFYLVDLGNIQEAASEEPAENFENVSEMNDLSEQNSFFSYCG